LAYASSNPFVKDPVRPNKVDRVIAANMGFGTTQTFDTEGIAYRRFPQVVVAFKNQMHNLRQLGIQPIAAAGEDGTPTGGTNPNGANAGDFNGMSLPAILNEVMPAPGSYPSPFTPTASTPPNDPSQGILPRPTGPVLAVDNNSTGTGADVIGSAAAITIADNVIFEGKLLVSSNRS